MAGREFRYEMRCDEALERLFTVIGKRMVPIKPPKDGRALERTAEDIYSAVGAAMCSAPSGAAQRPGLTATSFDVDELDRKPEKSAGAQRVQERAVIGGGRAALRESGYYRQSLDRFVEGPVGGYASRD